MWQSDLNKHDAIANFQAEVGKVGATKGSWQQDFAAACQQYRIVPCPYIRTIPSEIGQSLIFSNSVIDLSSWRAALIGVCVSGSAVAEVCVHNCTLTAQHLADLAVAIDSIGYFRTFKLEYSNFSDSSVSAVSDALKNLLGGAPGLEYVSLRGCKFGDGILGPALANLACNVTLQALNLSDNDLTDAFAFELVKSLRLNPFIRTVSLSRNQFSNASIQLFINLKIGMEPTADDAAFLKKLNSIHGERSKAIKAVNKKRKKAGEAEFPEPEALVDRNVVVDGKPAVVNKMINTIDLSWNQLTEDGIRPAIDSLITRRPSSSSAATAPGSQPIVFILRGMISDEVSRNRLVSSAGSSVVLEL